MFICVLSLGMKFAAGKNSSPSESSSVRLGFQKRALSKSVSSALARFLIELEGGVVFVVFNHIDSLPRYPDRLGQL